MTLRTGTLNYGAATFSYTAGGGNDLYYSGGDFACNGNFVARGSIKATGDVTATRVFNAVWNDVADFQLLNDELIYGKCYIDTVEGARLCTERCQLSVIGIASDTFGMGVGEGNAGLEVPIAIGGWVLAYVDQEYPCGTPLTNDEHGNLTEMTLQEKRDFPERLVAIYKKKEMKDTFGDGKTEIEVNGRHWVKVKS
ncbi:hypothetical protein DAY19_03405 [Halobacteriovorax vibrionivorans]|uniref:Peptidase G2 IMC autoproteolytic cleavage domain-containing protein n=1 Tax=Halobacteriovorax vibrionivorans TaxID=2152716 RepID=A0ABY0IL01_9BACT|nr:MULTISPECIES: hypothetical protein [Halobacteriovorax]RZF22833.1 hypothetical protein DAY19_03405 [Halobacteriovorax vibrionivorans]TGD47374.1 hypothetical protein EP118_08645 [Halobacteriovorax sp. Y22]